jgi:hypothetical protein
MCKKQLKGMDGPNFMEVLHVEYMVNGVKAAEPALRWWAAPQGD